MRRAGVVVHSALSAVRDALAPGVTTARLDEVARDVIRRAGAEPSFLGYADPPFPGVICASVNDEIVHGIPGDRVLAAGDLVGIDCGAIVDGWHADAAVTAVAGEPLDARDVRLLEVTREALWRGIVALGGARRLGEVGDAIDDVVSEAEGGPWGIVEGYTGHGIGRAMHEEPDVLNHRARSRGPRVRPGLCVAIEPMVTAGSPATRELADRWTVATVDGGRAAHFEHTVAVLEDGLWVLTEPDGGVAELLGRGVRVSALANCPDA
jgi:methionyl aminopeptidase